jgi:peptidoglycan/xylan/chitin deacetylase (PgdA/CDA1 family)
MSGRVKPILGIKSNSKSHIKRALTNSGLLSLAARLSPLRLAILKYHSIQDEPQQFAHSIGAGIIHSTAVFKEQMELVASKFDPVSMDDVLLFLCRRKGLPQKPVAITFDDGFMDNFEIANPILQRVGVPAAFYVTVASIDAARPPWFCRLRHAFFSSKKNTWTYTERGCSLDLREPKAKKSAFLTASERCARMTGQEQEKFLSEVEQELAVEPINPNSHLMMNWEQIRGLLRSGHIVGSHTMTHPNIAHVANAELQFECRESKRRLEEKLCAEVVHFSYPSPILQPHWSDETVKATKQCGYLTGVTSNPGPVQFGQDPLALRRVAVPNEREEFLWTVECSLLGRHM